DYYEVINASKDLVKHSFSRGIGNYTVSSTWKNADFRINFSKLRSHPIEMGLLSINNLEWMTGLTDEFVFIDRIVDRATTTNMLLDDFPPHYNIIEAYDNIPDGILGVMGSKEPIHPKRFYFSRDAIALDILLLEHIKSSDIPEKSTLKNTMHWFGVNEKNFEVIGFDAPIQEWSPPTSNFLWALLSFLSYPVYQFFSNKGEMFVPKMDLKAFPYKREPSIITKISRRINRWITNLPN
ncbi:MAG: DUF362 domain-containing protein, partial [Flavobacteriales bacterium]|nr:DUF362 domain-containing protein [Flavobacteriales bacterium]